MKAILVIDVPDDWHCTEWCVEGGLWGKNEGEYWMFCNEIAEAPLKPLPNKWYDNGSTSFAMGIARGFNKCLEEIEK